MSRKGKKFSSRLYFMFMGSLLIPIVIALLCFFFYSVNNVMEREESHIQNVLNSVSQNVSFQIAEIENIEKAFYIHSKVFQEAEALNNHSLFENDELTRLDIEKNYTVTMTKMMHTAAVQVRAVVLFPASGGDTAYYLGKSYADLKQVEYPDYEQEEWYQEVVDYPQRPVFLTSHMPEYTVNKRLGEVYSYINAIKRMDTHKIVGVVKIDVDMQSLQNNLDALEMTGNNGLVLLYKGNVMAKSGNLKGDAKLLDNGQFQVGNQDYQMTVIPVNDTGLELAYLSVPSTLYRGYFYLILFSAGVLALGMCGAFFNYHRNARKMVRDVQQITDVIRLVEKGRLDTYIKIRKDSEFAEIAETINQMTDNLKNYMEKEYVLVIQQKKAEFRALQSQINPHFLYNTLNGFVALNRMGEREILERSIIGLSKLFRYACSNRETVMVREELEFLEEYLQLEKLKKQERLEYIIWMDPACADRKIPKLLLQPIVENSINHGMGDTDGTMMIRIMANCTEVPGIGRIMVLTVRDNGVGFDQEEASKESSHVGIHNVRMRGELYCKNMIFQCSSKPGAGTGTTLVFPLEEEGEK